MAGVQVRCRAGEASFRRRRAGEGVSGVSARLSRATPRPTVNDDDDLLAVPGDDLRAFVQGPFDHLARRSFASWSCHFAGMP